MTEAGISAPARPSALARARRARARDADHRPRRHRADDRAADARQVDLGADSAQLQWFTASYTLMLAATMLPAGALGDRYGRKRLLLGALVLFGVASLVCAYAQTSGQLVGGSRPARPRGRRDDAAVDGRAAVAVPRPCRTRAGLDDLGDVDRARPAARADSRRLAARQLLVGLGVSDQRPLGRRRRDRGRDAGPGIAQRGGSAGSTIRRAALSQHRIAQPHLRLHCGWRARLGKSVGVGGDRRGSGGARSGSRSGNGAVRTR